MKRILAFITSPPLILAAVAFLAYGILAPQLGFYWDGLAISWIGYELGPEALTTYFSTNRPALGILYQSLTSLLPYKPIFWQILALILRWLSSLLLWAILRQLFPRQKTLSLTAALLFLLYPGFNQQFVSFVYSSHLTVLAFFLFSIYAMLKGTRNWTVVALLSSLINLLLGEYFFLLDLIRLPILWISLPLITGSGRWEKERIPRVISTWLPYFGILLMMIIGRTFLLTNETYEYSLLTDLKTAPLLALWGLTKTVFISLYTTLIAAWGQAFMLPDFELQGRVTIAIYLGIIFITFALVLYNLVVRASALSARAKQGLNPLLQSNNNAFTLITLGIFAALLAGIPFWLTGLPVTLGFPANRATLSFMLGSVFFLVGIISLIPRKNLRIAFFALIIAFSAGRQFLWADEFRRDWIVQRNFFWQMSWRIPALEKDTLILLNEGALKFYADNSLSAPLNWIYAPDATAEHIPYMLFYPRSRFGVDGEKLTENMPLTHDFIAGEFNGNSAQMVLINFSPPGCLHIIDPEIDSENKFISDLLIRDAAPFSRPELILTEGTPNLPEIYAPEPKHGWCYYYQKAGLARQRGDWEQVVKWGEKAFASGDYPNDPTENFVFIEAYAHTNAWGNAEQLSARAKRISPSYMTPLLCPLWERIERETDYSPDKVQSLERVKDDFNCK